MREIDQKSLNAAMQHIILSDELRIVFIDLLADFDGTMMPLSEETREPDLYRCGFAEGRRSFQIALIKRAFAIEHRLGMILLSSVMGDSEWQQQPRLAKDRDQKA